MKPRILFRVDGDEQIGAGHVLRSLALAARFCEQRAAVEFVCRRLSPGLTAKLEMAGLTVHRIADDATPDDDCRQLLEIAASRDAAWIVLDGYEFSADYRRVVYESGRQLLAVDDLGGDSFHYADLIVNPGLDAAQIGYRHALGTRLLLGPQYAPIGASFSALHEPRVTSPRACKLLATFGGSDPVDLSSRFLEAVGLVDRTDLEARLVVGPANPRQQALRQQRDAGGIACELVVDPQNMAHEMKWSDLAVSAAGSTGWELAMLGVPALLIVAAENQVPLAVGLARSGAAANLGWGHQITPQSLAREIAALVDDFPKRRQMSQRGQELVDGLGTTRVHHSIVDATIQLSPVTHNDARLLFDWANDPQTRAMSFSSQPISWEQHCRWLDERMIALQSCVFWLARNAHDKALAQVRYDLHEANFLEAVVSISVAAEHRGRGVGRRLLGLSARRLFCERGVRRIHAFTRPENEPSCRSLAAAGYKETAATTLRGQPARHFLLARE
jgi:UDP-2,4-diacetamido-2,4,6-trideoxy-beta-L-altropyranose hydrolase